MRRKISKDDENASPASRWITAKELAEMSGSSLSAAQKHVNTHCEKHYGKRRGEHGNTAVFVDRNDSVVQQFIERGQLRQERRRNARIYNEPINPDISVDDFDDNLLDPSNPLDVNDVQNTHGLELTKLIVSIRHKNAATQNLQLKNAIQRGDVIPREIVEKTLFGYLEALSAHLFDMCEQQADRFIAVVRRDIERARVHLIETLRFEHSRTIQEAKRNIQKTLSGVINE